MQPHELKRKHPQKKKKRVGRGGKKGTYSGRGMKGQKSRAGGTPRPVLRDLIKKFPKKRGYKFNSNKTIEAIVNLDILDKKFEAGEIVNLSALRKRKVIRKKDRAVKILGNGEIKKALVFEGYMSFSKSAQEKVEKAGGKINLKEKLRPTLPKAERPKKKRNPSKKKTAKKEEKKDKPKEKKDSKKTVSKEKKKTVKKEAKPEKAKS